MAQVDTNRPAEAEVSHRGNQWTGRLLLFLALLIAATVIVRHMGRGEFHLNTDEAHHAATSLYFADFLSDLPLTHPVQYTYEYYARYPVLGLIHWPPFFYLVEGIAFLLLGPSVVTARLIVLVFALLGLYFWFKLLQELQNEWCAAVGTLVLALHPSVLLYEKAVMLEVPSMALCIAASYFWIRFLRQGRNRFLYSFAVFAGLALLTKQQSVYLALFCALTLLLERKWRLLLTRDMLAALGVCLLLAGPFYFLAFKVHWQTITVGLFARAVPGANPYAYYWEQLPSQLGWVLLVLSVLGIVTIRWWGSYQNEVLMLAWVVACYIASTLIAGKEPRYILNWLPPLVYFAVAPLTSRVWRPRARPIAMLTVLTLLVTQAWSAWGFERPYLSGYATLAQRLTQLDRGGIVLFDGDLAANFTFYLRTYDPARRWAVMRKALYVTRNAKQFGSLELVKSVAGLQELIRSYGIKYVVIEDTDKFDFEIQKTLRELLQTSQFRLVAAIPIESNIPNLHVRRLLIFENKDAERRTAEYLHLIMLTLGHDIVVRLDRLGIP